MPDYRRPVKFGYFLIPNADAPLLSIAREVERLGLDYIAIQDHPYQRRFVDTWQNKPLPRIASREFTRIFNPFATPRQAVAVRVIRGKARDFAYKP